MVNIDKVTNSIAQPDVWLCHRNYDKICILSPIDDLKIYKTANAVDEISFTFHKINDDIEFEYWEQIKDLKVVLVDGFGYFEIAVDKNVSDDTTKVITGVSTEAELGQISIYELEVNGEKDRGNTDNFASNGGYIATTLYNPLDQEHSLLHKLLSKAPHWSFGSIAEIITDNGKEVSSSQIYRTFNFDNTNIYDALQEIAKEFDVVFTFNTVNRKINMYDLNKVGEDTTVYVSTENLANDFTCTSNKDSIKNCFKIVGGDDLINSAIRSINTNGSDYIYYFSPEQMEDMSDGLKTSLRAYDDLCEENKEEYENVCSDLYDAIDEVNELETAMFPDRPSLSPTTASAEIQKLTASNLGDIPVEKIDSLYETGAKRAVETIAQLKVDYRYEVDIEDGYTYDSTAHTFTCKFKVTSANDSAVSSTDIVLNLVEDQKETLQQKINNMLGEVDIEDSDIATFKTNLNKYSQKYLEDYTSIYKECTKVLSERGYDNKDKVSPDLYNFYHDYWEKWKACEEALAIRKSQVATASANKKELEDKLKELQDKLNFEKCLGGYYEEFCKYRREDTYQNDNYISDGMNTSELFKNAKQLVETATKELIKASTFQTTYTANLNNLFTNPIYEPFYEHFDLFNWIHADIDDKHIMLRLIGITFDFSAIDKIEVEFSEQVRNDNGLTDLQSILGQAKSMATSYSSTVKQALNGSEVCLEFDTLKQEGLNSALMNIKNSNNEEVVIDNCGINCKSKDQNDQYDQCQLRITGKNIVLTKDDFETASMAIGAGSYKGQEVYGVWGDLICGDILIGKELNILNSNSTLTMDENGLTITNGVNTIIFDPNNTELMNVTNNDKKIFYLNELGDLFIDGNIFGGSLHLENDLGTYVDIDPDKENIMEIAKKTESNEDTTEIYISEVATDYECIELPIKTSVGSQNNWAEWYTLYIQEKHNKYTSQPWYYCDGYYYILYSDKYLYCCNSKSIDDVVSRKYLGINPSYRSLYYYKDYLYLNFSNFYLERILLEPTLSSSSARCRYSETCSFSEGANSMSKYFDAVNGYVYIVSSSGNEFYRIDLNTDNLLTEKFPYSISDILGENKPPYFLLLGANFAVVDGRVESTDIEYQEKGIKDIILLKFDGNHIRKKINFGMPCFSIYHHLTCIIYNSENNLTNQISVIAAETCYGSFSILYNNESEEVNVDEWSSLL